MNSTRVKLNHKIIKSKFNFFRLYDWQTMNRKDVQDIVKNQEPNTQREFERRSKDIIVQFAEQGLNAAVYYENPDPREYVSLVPTSAITGKTIHKCTFEDRIWKCLNFF